MAATEGSSEKVDIHSRWPHEAYDFTPWLADNLHLLGDALGLKLELVRQEAAVGPFSLDILAKETCEDVLVAIENQLEWTDYSHLAQILTYAAGRDARIAIWVAPEFRYEYAEVLDWLNKWTSDEIEFYGVKIEVFKADDSSYREVFSKVVYPGGWCKENTCPSGEVMSERDRKYDDFFQPLIVDLLRMRFADKALHHFGRSGRRFPSGLEGIWYAVSLEGKNDAWVSLYIATGDNKLTKSIFDALEMDRAQIEACMRAEFGHEWHWNRHGNYLFSSINIRRDGSIDDPHEELEQTKAWMLDLLPKLKEVFNPRVGSILNKPRVVHYMKWMNGSKSLLAFGEDPNDMQVYRLYAPGRFERALARYPACAKFMPYAKFEERGTVDTVAEVEAKFGRVWTASMKRRELAGETV